MRLPGRGGRRPGAGAIVVLVGGIALLVAGITGDDGDRGGSATTAERARAEVQRVIDGDTIEVELDGRTEAVRYIGVDTPESVAPGQPVECFGRRASAGNAALVEGRRVRLVFGRERRDRYGRLLAYVHAGGRLVNAELLRRGYATTLEIAPNVRLAGEFRRLERRARQRGRGLWSPRACGGG